MAQWVNFLLCKPDNMNSESVKKKKKMPDTAVHTSVVSWSPTDKWEVETGESAEAQNSPGFYSSKRLDTRCLKQGWR